MTASQLHVTELTGIGVIDDQHQGILSLVTLLGELSLSGEREQIGRSIDALLASTLDHFEFEETLMEQSGYPFLKAHKRLHDYFIQRVAAYTQRFDAGDEVISEMVGFLHSWLHNHFSYEDRDYSQQVLAEIERPAIAPQAANSSGWLSRALYKLA